MMLIRPFGVGAILILRGAALHVIRRHRGKRAAAG
jgi:hypothetical protein